MNLPVSLPGARASGAAGRRGRVLVRLLGFAVAAVLLFVVVQNVPWKDSLVVRADPAAEGETFHGEILGDWKRDEVRFRFSPVPVIPEGSVLSGHALAGAATEGGVVTAAEDALGGVPFSVEWRPGMPRAFRELDLSGLLPAFGFVVLCTLFIVTRWWRLLALCGCGTTWWTAFRLTYVGLFFNVVLPGSTGGDLARAYVVVRDHPERRANALMSVLMDRILGLVAMAMLATIAIYTNDALEDLRIWVLLAFLAMVAGLAAFVNPTLRRLVRFDAIVERLPQARRLKKLDSALRDHADHPGEIALAVVLSLGNHLAAAAAVFWLARAFGEKVLDFHDVLCVATVANTLTAVPISPGGLGVGEVLYGTLFRLAGGMYMLGVAASFTYRLLLMGVGLLGGVVLLLPGGAEVRRDFAESRGVEGGAALD